MKQKYFAFSHRPSKTNKLARLSFWRGCVLSAGIFTLLASSSYGQFFRDWDGIPNSNWQNDNNWGGDEPNSATEVARFATVTGNDPASYGNAITIGGFSLTGGEARNLTFTSTIALGQYGVDNSSAFNLSISGAGTTTLTAAQTWSVTGTGSTTFGKAIANSGFLLTLDGSNTGTGTISGVISGSGGITKNGTGTWTLSNENIYTGITSINDGTLVVNGNQSGATGAVSVASIAKLFGNGTIGGATTILGTHSSGASAGVVGTTQSFSSTLSYSSGSIFEWDINVTGASAETHDQINAGTLSGTNAQFKIGLVGSGDSFASAFWDTSRNWTAANLFGASNVNANLATIFSNASTAANFTANSLQGTFSFTSTGGGTNNQLTWTAVPEPTSALAGILLGAGLLRRRRVAM